MLGDFKIVIQTEDTFETCPPKYRSTNHLISWWIFYISLRFSTLMVCLILRSMTPQTTIEKTFICHHRPQNHFTKLKVCTCRNVYFSLKSGFGALCKNSFSNLASRSGINRQAPCLILHFCAVVFQISCGLNKLNICSWDF